MLIAKAGSHLSHMKRDLNFFKSNLIACCLHSLLSLIGIFTRYLFALTNFDSSRRHTHATTHASGKQEIRPKMTSLDSIFFAEETIRALALSLAFTAENINNLPLAPRTCEKN